MWNNGPRFASNWIRNKTFSINCLPSADRFFLTQLRVFVVLSDGRMEENQPWILLRDPGWWQTKRRWAIKAGIAREPPIKILLNWFAPEFILHTQHIFKLNCWDSQRLSPFSATTNGQWWLWLAVIPYSGFLYLVFCMSNLIDLKLAVCMICLRFWWGCCCCSNPSSPSWPPPPSITMTKYMCPPVYTFTVN